MIVFLFGAALGALATLGWCRRIRVRVGNARWSFPNAAAAAEFAERVKMPLGEARARAAGRWFGRDDSPAS